MSSLTNLEKMRVVITGASGLLGREIMKAFSGCERVVGLAYSRVPEHGDSMPVWLPKGDHVELRKCDLTDRDAVLALLNEIEPEVIVHAAAEKRPDVCESASETDNVQALNVSSTRMLADYAMQARDCFLLFVSTDYVFDGTNPPYKTNSPTNPLNAYGRTKRDAEQQLWESGHKGGIVRVPVLYGPVTKLEESAITVLVPLVTSQAPVSIDDIAQRYPTHTADVASVLKALATRRMRHCGLSGTWHFSGHERMTKYEMALAIGKILGVSCDHITPKREVDPDAAPRPIDAHLDCSALKLMRIGTKTTPFEEGMRQVLIESGELNV